MLDKGDPNLDFDISFFSFGWKLQKLSELKDKRALSPETRGSGPLNFSSLCINLSVPFIHESFIFRFNFKGSLT